MIMDILEEINKGIEKKRKEMGKILNPEDINKYDEKMESITELISGDKLDEGEELMTHSTSLLYSEKDLSEPPLKLKKKY